MPFKNINHLQTFSRKTKDLAKGDVGSGGRHEEFTSETARSMLSRAVASRRDSCLLEQTTNDFSIRIMPTWGGDRLCSFASKLALSQYCE
jgi:hypothetical protein